MTTSETNEAHVRVNAWLRGLGGRTGLHLNLSDEGVCAVGHASGLDCAIEVPPGGGQLYLRVPLMPWAGQPLELAAHCLQRNLLGVGGEAASLALDTVSGELLLWIMRPLDVLDEDILGRLVLELFACAQECLQGLEEFVREHRAEQEHRQERDPAFVRG
jgi:hypothetical protein